jgi:hypothetical protein
MLRINSVRALSDGTTPFDCIRILNAGIMRPL